MEQKQIKQYQLTTLFLLIIGIAFLIGGINLYLSNTGDSMPEKVGNILITCGALFIGIGYAVWIKWTKK